jgi:hypothetical protein
MENDANTQADGEGPIISQEAQCKGCDGDLVKIESSYACQDQTCIRNAVPVNEYGNTDAEQEEETQAAGEAADERAASEPTWAERYAHQVDQYRRGSL